MPLQPPQQEQDADEGAWLESLVASERLGGWAEALRQPGSPAPQRQRQALQQLLEALGGSPAYREEAQDCGILPSVAALSSSPDSELAPLAHAVLGLCAAGPDSGGRVRELRYGAHTLRLQEGRLADGLGGRVWPICHALCRVLAEQPGLVRGRRVLELGSGLGALGLLCAALGAQQVVLTDHVDALLALLLVNRELNQPSLPPQAAVSVRFLDWSSRQPGQDPNSSNRGAAAQPAAHGDRHSGQAASSASLAEGEQQPSSTAPELEPGATFEVVLGSDLLYEAEQGPLVAATVAERLAPGGTALIACAVRSQEHLTGFLAAAERLGLRADTRKLGGEGWERGPDCCTEEERDMEREYEGGFVLASFTWGS